MALRRPKRMERRMSLLDFEKAQKPEEVRSLEPKKRARLEQGLLERDIEAATREWNSARASGNRKKAEELLQKILKLKESLKQSEERLGKSG